MNKRKTAALVVCVWALTVTTANAQYQQCGPRTLIVAQLHGERFKEARHGRGLTGRDDALAELYVSDAGTWTLIVTRARDGMACVVAAGTDWDNSIELQPKGRPL